MVEKSPHVSTGNESWWPHVSHPFRHLGAKVANFFAPGARGGIRAAKAIKAANQPPVTLI